MVSKSATAATARLRGYSKIYLLCRDQRHQRSRVGAYRFRDEETGERFIAVEYECLNCEFTSTDFLDPVSKERIFTRVKYPRGYLFKYGNKNDPRVNRTHIREAFLKDDEVFKNHDELVAKIRRRRK